MSGILAYSAEVSEKSNRVQKWTTLKIIYTVLMAFNLLSFLWLLINGSGIEDIPSIIWITRLTSALVAIVLGKIWRDTGFRILFIYTVLFTLRCIINNSNNLFINDVAESVLSAIWLFAGCYGLGRILDEQETRVFLTICAVIWIACIAVLSIIGLHIAWYITEFGFFENAKIFINYDFRLHFFYLSTISGSILATTALMAAYFAVCSKKGVYKALYVIAFLSIITDLSLTDSRTACICCSVGLGFMALVAVYKTLKTGKRIPAFIKDNLPVIWIVSVLMAILISVISVWGILQITPFFNHLKTRGIIPRAYGEEIDATKLALLHRGFTGNDVMNGRVDIWKEIFSYLVKHPLLFLTGESKLYPLGNITTPVSHSHNIFIQVLLESGIPGFLLVLGFTIYIVLQSIRLMSNTNRGRWIRMLPAIPLALVVGDLVECYLSLKSSQCVMITVFFLSAGIISTQAMKKKTIK